MVNINIESLKELVMQQAKEKGFGVNPEDLDTPEKTAEKIALIHSEITEAYQAYLANQMDGKDGYYEELGDILQRTLHLGGIYGINFEIPIDCSEITDLGLEAKLLTLHAITSEAYENYRHKKDDQFKIGLSRLAYAVIEISRHYEFSLEEAVKVKIERNLGRKWDPSKYRERFTVPE